MTDILSVATEQQKTSIVNQINDLSANGSKYKELLFLKSKSQLSKIIKTDNGVTDTLAINLYWDTLLYFCKLKKYRSQCGGIVCTYEELSEIYDISKESIRRKLVRLEKFGLISRGFENGNKSYTHLVNQLIIYVWKNTPYFINKSGIVAPVVKGGDHA